MSYAEEVMNEIKNEQNAAAEAPVQTEQQTEPTPEPAPEPEKVEEKQEVVDNQPEPEKEPEKDKDNQPEPEPEKEEPKKEPKPDLSKLSKEEKAEHAFQRQLSKQKAKYESSIDDLKKSFQSQFDDLKKQLTANKEPEAVKTRSDFENDDEYISYLGGKAAKEELDRRAEEEAKKAAEKAEQDQRDAEAEEQRKQIVEYFDKNARNAFGEQYGDFEKLLKKGYQNGLAEVLDEAPAVRDYIFGNPDGPAVLNEILNSKESFIRVMSRAANPMTAIIECHDLAKEISARKSAPEQPQPRTVMPNIGKPGAGSAPSTAPSMFKDDDSLIDFVRRHR